MSVIIIITPPQRPKNPKDKIEPKSIEMQEVEGESTADLLRRAAEQVESEG